MSTGTAAEHAERAAQRFATARKMTEKSQQVVGVLASMVSSASLTSAYFGGELALVPTLAAALGSAAFITVYLRLVRAGFQGCVLGREVVVGYLLAAGLSAMVAVQPAWCAVGPIWVSAAAVVLPGRRRIAALSVAGALISATALTLDTADRAHWYMWPTMVVLFTLVCAVAASVSLAQKWMWQLFLEAYSAREAQAILAVSEERLRFARDVHDLLGHNLSLIAVKSELAIRLTETDPARARAEMADVRTAARDALREVRAAVRGYRVMALDAELASVRAVLEAAGVRCTFPDTPPDLPPDVREVLAWVVREGVTNLLKHSDARHCTISLAEREGEAVLELSNDGARPATADPGSGLAGLTERIEALGGRLTTERSGQRFVLRVTAPLPVRSAA
jgi:two-component system, NarL family, sensor histidine kinase DesK